MLNIKELKQDVIATYGDVYNFIPVIGLVNNNQLLDDLQQMREKLDFFIGSFNMVKYSYDISYYGVNCDITNLNEITQFDYIKEKTSNGRAFIYGLICIKK